MATLLKINLICLFSVFTYCLSFAQDNAERLGTPTTISSIHPIEQVKNHYASLQQLSTAKRAEFQWMDTISFSPDLYKNYSILFALIEPFYLSSEQVTYLSKSVEYPSNSSAQTSAEIEFLLKLQRDRTEKQVNRVLEIAAVGYWPDINYVPSHSDYKKNLDDLFFECREIMGENCTYDKYPETSKLLQGVMNDMRLMEFKVKYRLRRARPYQLEPKIEPLQIMGSPSFASGHTLWAYVQAYTLAELIPNKRKAFLELAYEIGLSREILGVHYPSDEEASRQLAHRMLMLMWHTEKFQEDFKAAKEEWEQVN